MLSVKHIHIYIIICIGKNLNLVGQASETFLDCFHTQRFSTLMGFCLIKTRIWFPLGLLGLIKSVGITEKKF